MVDREVNQVNVNKDINLKNFDFSDRFTSATDDLINDFYIPALSNSIKYDRAAGYFTSALLAIAPLAFAHFALRGGKMRILCSPSLTKSDYESIYGESSYSKLGVEKIAQELTDISESDEMGKRLSVSLSSLIHAEILMLKVLIPQNSPGIFHPKFGIFSDGINSLSFSGSANETAAAWLTEGNYENFEVFTDWKNPYDANRVKSHEYEFETLWTAPPGLRFARQNEIREVVYSVSAPINPEISLQRLREILIKKNQNTNSYKVIQKEKILQKHQNDAIDNWKINNKRGVISFATGGGKTLTAIKIIREWLNAGGSALVLVPSRLLHNQWYKEINTEAPDLDLLGFGAGISISKKESLIRGASSTKNVVIISTYNTAGKSQFLNAINKDKNLLIVADEVHTAGQPSFAEFLKTPFLGPRLGLSATPERYNDAEGTRSIFEFFGEVLEPRFTLEDAISVGRLVPYNYFFETCSLNQQEMDEWRLLTSKIGKLMAQSATESSLSESVKSLLIKRARIAKGASGKTSISYRILKDNYRRGDRWLIYCADKNQLNDVKMQISSLNLKILDYYQDMQGGRSETLDSFGRDGGVLLAIKCLDEGVDIPLINKAIILASSTNSREYIQRRGRVLRSAEDKLSADIWDVIVTDDNDKLLTINEARRALSFSKSALNKINYVKLQTLLADSRFESIDLDFEENPDED